MSTHREQQNFYSILCDCCKAPHQSNSAWISINRHTKVQFRVQIPLPTWDWQSQADLCCQVWLWVKSWNFVCQNFYFGWEISNLFEASQAMTEAGHLVDLCIVFLNLMSSKYYYQKEIWGRNGGKWKGWLYVTGGRGLVVAFHHCFTCPSGRLEVYSM